MRSFIGSVSTGMLAFHRTATGPPRIAKLPMAVLLVFAENDSVSQKHVVEFFALLGGGVKEPGWLNTQMSKSRLAVVPGYSHSKR